MEQEQEPTPLAFTFAQVGESTARWLLVDALLMAIADRDLALLSRTEQRFQDLAMVKRAEVPPPSQDSYDTNVQHILQTFVELGAQRAPAQ